MECLKDKQPGSSKSAVLMRKPYGKSAISMMDTQPVVRECRTSVTKTELVGSFVIRGHEVCQCGSFKQLLQSTKLPAMEPVVS